MNDGISMPESHSTWDFSSLTKDGTVPPAVKAWSLNHWTPREVPGLETRELALSPSLA